ncbi:tetratricopeptide repeat protein [Thiorhodococcus mannitoliphagus]|uniref:Tetratricopeptide repeat protein n=1 Tax=Thiorhodococcus mannitoliphagus TaxID=329406 RepID=A0A6P1DY25_9GAMM|nr:tetratricopeptide repeat protein [Thiorhodococcus mannitoliphagus]NEX23217.1 tetratricopeptide repeat protein [Thiorhodococcus mannitoliphagus]
MPKLSPLHWIALLAFLIFYGFTVFALTRDYYLRHPAQPATRVDNTAVRNAPTASAPGLSASAIPESITESNPVLLHQQADALFVERRFPEAVRVYRRILELNPEDAEAYNDLGLSLHYAGDTKAAIAQLKIAVSKASDLQRPWLTLGFLSLQAGKETQAKAALERARDLDPESDIGKEASRLLGMLAEG